MNEVITLAFDLKIPIYYQDTDSMHIELDGINPETNEHEKDYNLKKLSIRYKEIYKRELIGMNLSQFILIFKR